MGRVARISVSVITFVWLGIANVVAQTEVGWSDESYVDSNNYQVPRSLVRQMDRQGHFRSLAPNNSGQLTSTHEHE